MIVADGLRKVGPDAEKLRAYLAGLNGYKGLVRTYSVDPATNNLAHSLVLVAFKPGTKTFSAVTAYPKAP